MKWRSRASQSSIIIENQTPKASSPQIMPNQALRAPPAQEEPPEPWNRWLLITQLFLAPLFIVFAIYNKPPTDVESSWPVRPIIICLLVSSVVVAFLAVASLANPAFAPPVIPNPPAEL